MTEHVDFDRLERYIRGEGTPEELAALREWVQADPDRVSLVQAMRTVGRESRIPEWDVEGALARLQAQVGIPTRRSLRLRSAIEARRIRRWPIMVAAGIVAVAIAGSLVLGDGSLHERQHREVVTAPGQRALLNLSDGSKVVLAAQSRLRIPREFGASDRPRELWLEGEAFFTVHHDANRPFVVHTPNGVTEDLGTEFMASAYPEVNGTRVAVREGHVALRRSVDSVGDHGQADNGTVLSAGDVALLTNGGVLTVSKDRDVARFFAGAEGLLVLDDIVLRDAMPRVERWYGVSIDATDETLLARRVSGEFRTETVLDALNVIAIALGAEVSWNQGRAILQPSAGRVEAR